MKIKELLINYDALKPQTKETFISGVKLGFWMCGILIIITILLLKIIISIP